MPTKAPLPDLMILNFQRCWEKRWWVKEKGNHRCRDLHGEASRVSEVLAWKTEKVG